MRKNVEPLGLAETATAIPSEKALPMKKPMSPNSATFFIEAQKMLSAKTRS